jgi:hypothetical protein
VRQQTRHRRFLYRLGILDARSEHVFGFLFNARGHGRFGHRFRWLSLTGELLGILFGTIAPCRSGGCYTRSKYIAEGLGHVVCGSRARSADNPGPDNDGPYDVKRSKDAQWLKPCEPNGL